MTAHRFVSRRQSPQQKASERSSENSVKNPCCKSRQSHLQQSFHQNSSESIIKKITRWPLFGRPLRSRITNVPTSQHFLNPSPFLPCPMPNSFVSASGNLCVLCVSALSFSLSFLLRVSTVNC